MNRLLNSASPSAQASIIDKLYDKSVNSVRQLGWLAPAPFGAIMFAYTPEENVSMVSFNHRIHLLILAGRMTGDEFENMSHGQRVVEMGEEAAEAEARRGPRRSELGLLYLLHVQVSSLQGVLDAKKEDEEIKTLRLNTHTRGGQKQTFRVTKKIRVM